MQLGPLGFPELLFLFVLALIVFGPRRLPEIGRTIGRAVAELRRGAQEVRKALEDEVDVAGIRRDVGLDDMTRDLGTIEREARDALREDAPPSAPPPATPGPPRPED